ncbi:unnamed protein product [Heterosigma akashiwo]|mmetsp:Transcript_17832/g.24540  ORF Transcript_17832/g.24540 Transcript_17832/m.24540 type:complete len:173 (+) Transcript_17832:28-546(+)|eukprot:CAMPEP_0194581676 /NCGR_PEP_ID=MMETSP0292-20121207/15074_1 /TAXON_ID=39354 /ORGANISM="Heterosigma akashiwo, Strain CCMP2393" /LENGTH=172 /DNA_ID=CAMNT_0039435529 /DNA_START=33 /DNA_END=551 /DNA_ORIENTATION=+
MAPSIGRLIYAFLFLTSIYSPSVFGVDKSNKVAISPSFFHEENANRANGEALYCPVGMYREDNQCHCCPRGTYGDSNSLTSSSECTECPEGTFRDQLCGAVEGDCLPCPVGTYGSSTGLTTPYCTGFCAKNYYSYEEGQTDTTNCEACPSLYYNWQCRTSKWHQFKNLVLSG